MKPKNFRKQAKSLYWMARSKRALRMFLRAAWAGGAGYLLGWGINGIWGILPRQVDWYTVGFVFAFLNLLFIFFRIGTIEEFMWRLDRQLGLKEQYITAWQVSKQTEAVGVEELLLTDMVKKTPEVWARVAKKSGSIKREGEALIIVIILFLIIYLIGLINFPDLPGLGFDFLPGLGGEGSAESLFPSGVPGDTGTPNEDPSSGDGDGPAEMGPSERGETGETLEDLGEDLQDHGATSELGESLEDGDLGDAADQLEELSDQVDELSQETRDEIAQDLREAADQLDQPGQEELKEDLLEAAEALESGDDAAASEALDGLAETLRGLGGETGDQEDQDVGASEGETGADETFDRLGGEGETISLDDLGEEGAGLLQPGEAGEGGVVVGEDTDAVGGGDGEVGAGVVAPIDIPWTEQDVVEEYFTP